MEGSDMKALDPVDGCDCFIYQGMNMNQDTIDDTIDEQMESTTSVEFDADTAYEMGYAIGSFRAGLVEGGDPGAVMPDDQVNYLTRCFVDRLLDMIFEEIE